MRAFLTGSKAYGLPTEESDTDVVILTEDSVIWALQNLSNEFVDGNLKIGKLNIIAVRTEEEFSAWKVGTSQLIELSNIEGRHITREEAVEHFRNLFKSLNLNPEYPTNEIN